MDLILAAGYAEKFHLTEHVGHDALGNSYPEHKPVGLDN